MGEQKWLIWDEMVKHYNRRFHTKRQAYVGGPSHRHFLKIVIRLAETINVGRPDALSKTIPIWCCVLNRALFPSHPESHDLHVPPSAVSASEKSQMLARIPEGLDAFLQLKPDLATLRAQLSKPLRPTWITQETTMTTATAADDDDDDRGEIFEKFRPVVCCTSSRRVVDGEMSGHAGYVQGAGDDTENWAHGLTPPVFWAHADALLGTPEGDLPDLIRSLVAAFPPENFDVGSTSSSSSSSSAAADALPPSVRRLTPHLYVSPLPLPLSLPGGDATWCTIALVSTPSPPGTWARSPRHMEVGLGRHKAASRNLRTALVTICSFATRFLTDDSASSSSPGTDVDPQQALNQQPRKRILVACETSGKDLAVGVALALLCWCFEDEEGAVVRRIGGEGAKYAAAGESEAAAAPGPETNSLPSFNKTMIRIRLGRIMMAMPDANPNRATLQSVNSFLMDWVK